MFSSRHPRALLEKLLQKIKFQWIRGGMAMKYDIAPPLNEYWYKNLNLSRFFLSVQRKFSEVLREPAPNSTFEIFNLFGGKLI